jgi:hypothetical protein
LEQASCKIENQARQQAKNQTQNQTTQAKASWAKVADLPTPANLNSNSNSNSNSNIQNWTLVSNKKANQGSRAKTSKNISFSSREKQKAGKVALSKRCTLLQVQRVQASSFSSIRIRDLINNAFKAKGIQGLVISTVSLSIKGNIIVNTTPEFNADFLISNEAIIKGVLPLVVSLKKGEPWYKVVIHGIPIREFETADGLNLDLVIQEIKTFNKGLNPIGRPYWITSKENRDSGLVSNSLDRSSLPYRGTS